MIPISLTIKGLYSYKESQTIDFKSLTSSGLFGIFGAVGSGKSSILEAIVFVLYGKSDRLNEKNDNRYYNMLNLQSDEMMLEFDFLAGVNNSSQYRFRFLAKRSKKEFEKVEVKERNFYEWKDNSWLPLEGISDASSIIGMSHQNFMQTIIIPQGKFREFVDRTAGERTKMLKELFHLDRFDLSQKTNLLISNNKADIDKLEGRLEELGDVDEAAIKIKEADLVQMKLLLQEAELKCNAKKQEAEKLSILKNLFAQIKGEQEKLFKLENQKQDFFEKEQKLNAYEKAFTFLKEKIRIREGLLNDIKESVKDIEEIKVKLSSNEAQSKSHETVLLSAKEAYDNREKVKNTCDDLDTIIKIKKISERLAELKIVFEKEQKNQILAEKEFKNIKDLLHEKELTLANLETSLLDISELQQVHYWFQRKEDLAKEVVKQKEHVVKSVAKLQLLESQKVEIFNNEKSSLSFDEIANYLQKENEEEENKKIMLEKEIQALLVQQKLLDYSNDLEAGKPCPLCGSLNHPAIASIHNVEDQIKVKEKNLKNIELLQKKLKLLETKLQKLIIEFNNQNSVIKEKKVELSEVEAKLIDHQSSFMWSSYSSDHPEVVKEKITAVEEESKVIQKLKTDVKNLKEEIEKKENVYSNITEHLRKIDNEICSEDAKVKTLEGQLKQLSYEKISKYTLNQLQESLQKGLNQQKLIVKNYEDAVVRQQELLMENQMFSQQIFLTKEANDRLQEKLKDLEADIVILLEQKGFESLTQVNQVLSLTINLEKERREIEAYNRELHSTKATLEKHYDEADGHEYDEPYHDELDSQLNLIESQVKELKKEYDVQGHEIEGLQKRLNVKNNCIKELEQLLLRAQNLKELRKLFTGNGFVRYVSSIYLQDLCKAANQRFFKLTQNNLSLELNQEEEFIVRDYLNNGKTRLLKTLSGGQTFQAALCLALALAENIKSLNKAEQSFFFLDEGFGSLDKESLRIVFDTLKTLRNENRIVGIISHVEELQQEIDVYLNIKNDKDRGSIVSYSWR